MTDLRRIRIDGVDARYLLSGSGAPVLILASPLVLARTYLPLVRTLSRSFTVVVVELPGAGGSERLEHAWSFERYGAWTIDLVRRMPLAHPVIIGHSDSAPVAIEAARMAPEEVRALVLVGPCGACESRSIARVVAARAVDALGEPIFTVRGVPHLLTNVVRHRRVFFEHVRAAAEVDAIARVRDVRVRTLLAWGERDRTVPLACAARFGRQMPEAKLVVGRGSHDWLATQPEAFTSALRRFLAA